MHDQRNPITTAEVIVDLIQRQKPADDNGDCQNCGPPMSGRTVQ